MWWWNTSLCQPLRTTSEKALFFVAIVETMKAFLCAVYSILAVGLGTSAPCVSSNGNQYMSFRDPNSFLNVIDIVLLLQTMAGGRESGFGLSDLEVAQIRKCGDYDNNNKINILDVVYFLQYIVGDVTIAEHHRIPEEVLTCTETHGFLLEMTDSHIESGPWNKTTYPYEYTLSVYATTGNIPIRGIFANIIADDYPRVVSNVGLKLPFAQFQYAFVEDVIKGSFWEKDEGSSGGTVGNIIGSTILPTGELLVDGNLSQLAASLPNCTYNDGFSSGCRLKYAEHTYRPSPTYEAIARFDRLSHATWKYLPDQNRSTFLISYDVKSFESETLDVNQPHVLVRGVSEHSNLILNPRHSQSIQLANHSFLSNVCAPPSPPPSPLHLAIVAQTSHAAVLNVEDAKIQCEAELPQLKTSLRNFARDEIELSIYDALPVEEVFAECATLTQSTVPNLVLLQVRIENYPSIGHVLFANSTDPRNLHQSFADLVFKDTSFAPLSVHPLDDSVLYFTLDDFATQGLESRFGIQIRQVTDPTRRCIQVVSEREEYLINFALTLRGHPDHLDPANVESIGDGTTCHCQGNCVTLTPRIIDVGDQTVVEIDRYDASKNPDLYPLTTHPTTLYCLPIDVDVEDRPYVTMSLHQSSDCRSDHFAETHVEMLARRATFSNVE